MTKPMKIRVFDDNEKSRKHFLERILTVGLSPDRFDIDLLTINDFQEALNGMQERQAAFRKEGRWETIDSNILDDVDILIIDYDLFEAQPFLDAERIAYLARVFTTCGIIVVLNRIGHNTFDLTLKDHFESFADLDIGQDQLGNPFLWTTDRRFPNGFAPWYWPALPVLAEDFRKRVEDVQKAIDRNDSIWTFFGFSETTRNSMPQELIQLLGDTPEETKFEDFVLQSNFGLALKDRAKAVEEDGSIRDTRTIARVAAARIGKWLEYQILPEMDILIDAPHLALRLPSLVKGDEIEIWNDIVIRHALDIPNFNSELIEEFRFRKSHWISRPVWFWRDILERAEIPDIREPWKIRRPNWEFCEDMSQFQFSEDCQEFWAVTISPFANRYIHNFSETDNVKYQPPMRLAM